MTHRRRTRVAVLLVLLLAALALVAGPVGAQDPGTAKEPSGTASDGSKDWEFSVTPYIWMVSLNGDATVKGVTQPVDVGFFDIFSKTDFAFGLQAHVEAWNKRKWGLWFDGTWVVLKNNDIPAGPVMFDLKTNIGYFEIGGLYNFIEKPFTTEPDSATWSIQEGRVGIEPNRKALEALFRCSYEQGLAQRILKIEELFHPSTLKLKEAQV